VRISPARYRLIAAIALGLLIAIVITGAAVRLTGSGLGCDDWPNCNDTKLIDVSSNHTAIEQVNRLFTGAVALAVIAAVLGSLWRTPRRRDLVLLSVGLVAGVLAQIVLGGITVLVDLHPLAVQGHMLLSMILVATAVVLLRRAGEPDDAVRRPAVSAPTRRLTWGVTIGTAVAIVAGTVVTGAGPHAGDEDVQRFDVAIENAARVHGIAVMATVAVALLLAWRVHRHADERPVLSNAISSWLFVAVLQGAIGYIQYFNDVPELLVGLHVAGATALWSMTVWLLLSTSSAGATNRAATDPLLASV
jgi:cytochrome c oxidase assembly protein subunit 15